MQPTLLCEERCSRAPSLPIQAYCNPRSCARSDVAAGFDPAGIKHCNPRSCARSDDGLNRSRMAARNCNPRSCARSDEMRQILMLRYVIATHAPVRGAIRWCRGCSERRIIATHAPVRGAISTASGAGRFEHIATHAPVRGAIRAVARWLAMPRYCNPRSCARSDVRGEGEMSSEVNCNPRSCARSDPCRARYRLHPTDCNPRSCARSDWYE